MEIESGTKILQYRLDCLIGSGGWGQVWKAHDDNNRGAVAIKILKPAGAESAIGLKARERFKREAEVMSRLQSPWLCHAYTCCEECAPFMAFVMEYIEGCNLSEHVRREGVPQTDKIKGWLFQLLAALNEIHSKGIVHRDIKPSNIMLQPSGDIKLFDFGICKDLTVDYHQTHAAVYSMYYASPEQKLGDTEKPITAASDYYSLGKTLLFLSTGKTPPPGRVTDSHLAMVADADMRTIIRAFTLEDAAERYAAVRIYLAENWGDELDELPTLVDLPYNNTGKRATPVYPEAPTMVDTAGKQEAKPAVIIASTKYLVIFLIVIALILAVYFALYNALLDTMKIMDNNTEYEMQDEDPPSISYIGNPKDSFHHF